MGMTRGGGVALLLAASCLTACHPVVRHRHAWFGDNGWHANADKPETVAASLDCPETQGDLRRVSVAPDGKSCAYEGDGDQEVSLRLIPLDGKAPQDALAGEEAALRALVPVRAAAADAAHVAGTVGGPDKDGDKDDAEDKDDDQGRANIDLPGIHISAQGNKADVKVFGTDIKADGNRADIHTDIGSKGTTIHAGPGGAEIRAGSVGRHAAQMVYILAGDDPGPTGYRAVGLLARGPVDGPLVVAEFRSKARHEGHGDNDLQGLIDRNVTVKDGDDD